MKQLAWTQFEGDQVLTWRAQSFYDAGMDEELAAALARSSCELHYGTHVVRSGLKNGVTPELIADLLAD